MKIEFTATYGDEQKQVELSFDQWGTCGWVVLIDRYNHGTLYKRDGKWTCYTGWLYGDDIFILGEMIDEYLKIKK